VDQDLLGLQDNQEHLVRQDSRDPQGLQVLLEQTVSLEA